MPSIPKKFRETVLELADELSGKTYAFRGTTSLVLQDLEMNIDDIDIICPRETALKCNKLLERHLTEEVSFKKTAKYKSYYGKFLLNEIEVEIMGEWQIKDTEGHWSQPYDGRDRKEMDIDDQSVYVTPVSEELKMFAQMGRWNAYHKIRRQRDKANHQESLL